MTTEQVAGEGVKKVKKASTTTSTKSKATAAKKSAAKAGGTGKAKSKTKTGSKPKKDWRDDIKSNKPASNFINQLIFDRVIESIEVSNLLPWMRPFIAPSMNYVTCREYTGVNKLLLQGGEYMTNLQIKQFNAEQEKKGLPQYWYGRDAKTEVVVYYSRKSEEVTAAVAEEGRKNPSTWIKYEQVKGVWYRIKTVLSYTDVINIIYIRNAAGEPLPTKLGVQIEETFTSAEDIIRPYQQAMGIKEVLSPSGAYHQAKTNTVHMPRKEWFNSSEAYYRTLFHEYAHSTGVPSRLNRDSLAKYHQSEEERSREEVVAEVCAVLLASEAGFRGEGTYKNEFLQENSLSYIAGWVEWMKNYPDELVKGIREAERAKTYILTAGASTYEGFSVSTTASDKAKELGLKV